MITKETAQKIWSCYEGIDKCKKLLCDMKEQLEKSGDERLIDAFGRKKGLELGVPMGNDGHRIFNVRIDLAIQIIEAHAKEQEDELRELEAIVKIEMKG